MNKIKEGGFYKMTSVIESAESHIEITDPNGKMLGPITKSHARQYYSADDLTVHIYDALLDVTYWSLTNELEDGTGVISAVDTATDKAAVKTYLGGFVGVV